MILLTILTPIALAGILRVETTLPAEVAVDDVKVATVMVPSSLHFNLADGQHKVSIWVEGTRTNYDLVLSKESAVTIVAGQGGVSVDMTQPAPTNGSGSTRQLQVRSTSNIEITVIIDGERMTLPPAGQREIDLAIGLHTIQVRSAEGTVIWAQDTLQIEPGEPAILQVTDGVAPELFGEAIVFGSESPL